MVPDAATENFGIESSKVKRRAAFENETEFILETQALMGCGLIFHRFEEAHSRRIPQNRCSREHLGLRTTASQYRSPPYKH